MDFQWYYIVAIALVLVIGVAAFANSRRRAGERPLPPSVPTSTIDTTPTAPDETVPEAADPRGGGVITEAPPESTPEPVVEPEPQPLSLRDRLAKARSALSNAFSNILGRSAIDDETWDDLEEALLRADVGLSVTDSLLDALKAKVDAKEITEPSELLDALQADMVARLADTDRTLRFDDTFGPGEPNIWMFVGVNGVGKTTSIGKVARQQTEAGRSLLLAAGDTFRAAAADQLQIWAERSNTEFVRGAEGGDPSSVIFDGVEKAAASKVDLVLADTAGRLHNKTNLMEELKKVRRVAEKGAGTVTETLLVIDATTGQNGMAQAKVFSEATDVTGVVLTKLDGSAKGGIVFAIETELGIPVKLVGIGEQVDDLIAFDPTAFVAALFDRDA